MNVVDYIVEACRPILSETKSIHENDVESFYHLIGSSVLIANSKNYYLVTASHVIDKFHPNPDNLRIFLSHDSKFSLPINCKFSILNELNEDYKDLCMFRIDLELFESNGDVELKAQDVDKGFYPEDKLNLKDELCVIGYPSESNVIDYDNKIIKNKIVALKGSYIGNKDKYVHSLTIDGELNINDYDGLSGSPVFYIRKTYSKDTNLITPLLAGICIQGSSSSRIIHFIGSSVIREMVTLADLGSIS